MNSIFTFIFIVIFMLLAGFFLFGLPEKQQRKIPIYITIIIGMVWITISLYWGLNTALFVQGALVTEGTVIDIKPWSSRHSKSSGKSTFAPLVSFTDQHGVVVKFKGSYYTAPPSYSIGDKVKVLYQEKNPADATIDSFEELWLGSLIMLGVGILIFLCLFIAMKCSGMRL